MSDRVDANLKEYFRAVSSESEELVEPCPGDEVLFKYRSRTLDPMFYDKIQGHLITCHGCRSGVLDADAFLGLRSPAFYRTSNWKVQGLNAIRLWKATKSDRVFAAYWALAATLLVATCVSTIWALKSHSQMLSAETARGHFEQQKRSLEAQLARLERPPSVSTIDAPNPLLNLGLHDLLPSSSVARSAGQPFTTTIRTASSQPFLVLLNAAGQPAYPNYAIEIVSSIGRSVWSSRGLSRDPQQNYSILIPSRFLNSGDYVIQISGVRNDIFKPLAEYKLRLVTSP